MQEFIVFFLNFIGFLISSVAKKKNAIAFFFRSATRTRTGVYGVRGRCPRPLDDSTRKCPRQSGKLASAGRGI